MRRRIFTLVASGAQLFLLLLDEDVLRPARDGQRVDLEVELVEHEAVGGRRGEQLRQVEQVKVADVPLVAALAGGLHHLGGGVLPQAEPGAEGAGPEGPFVLLPAACSLI